MVELEDEGEEGTREDSEEGDEYAEDEEGESAEEEVAPQKKFFARALGKPETETTDEDRNDSLFQELAEVFAPDELPDEMRERLLQEGYVLIDRGALQGFGYVPESSIQNVTTDGIHLNIPGDNMLTR